ncbi:MAG: DoxX family protein [Planctomycetaceae bacterium]|nr:DoxX family protein [Planctomycetaceae bacterium]
MSVATKDPKSPAWMYWTGWGISGLVSLGLAVSAAFKFIHLPEVTKEFARLGYADNLAFGLGIVEIGCTILYLIPQTSVLGAILLTGYLGGATATHVRIGDPFIPPIIFGILVWVGIFLRDPRLRVLLPLRRPLPTDGKL